MAEPSLSPDYSGQFSQPSTFLDLLGLLAGIGGSGLVLSGAPAGRMLGGLLLGGAGVAGGINERRREALRQLGLAQTLGNVPGEEYPTVAPFALQAAQLAAQRALTPQAYQALARQAQTAPLIAAAQRTVPGLSPMLLARQTPEDLLQITSNAPALAEGSSFLAQYSPPTQARLRQTFLGQAVPLPKIAEAGQTWEGRTRAGETVRRLYPLETAEIFAPLVESGGETLTTVETLVEKGERRVGRHAEAIFATQYLQKLLPEDMHPMIPNMAMGVAAGTTSFAELTAAVEQVLKQARLGQVTLADLPGDVKAELVSLKDPTGKPVTSDAQVQQYPQLVTQAADRVRSKSLAQQQQFYAFRLKEGGNPYLTPQIASQYLTDQYGNTPIIPKGARLADLPATVLWMDVVGKRTLKGADKAEGMVNRLDFLLFGGTDTEGTITGTKGSQWAGILADDANQDWFHRQLDAFKVGGQRVAESTPRGRAAAAYLAMTEVSPRELGIVLRDTRFTDQDQKNLQAAFPKIGGQLFQPFQSSRALARDQLQEMRRIVGRGRIEAYTQNPLQGGASPLVPPGGNPADFEPLGNITR